MMVPVHRCGCSMLSIVVLYTVMVAFCGAFPGPGTGSGGEATTTVDPSIVANPFHDPYYHHHPPQNLPPPTQMVYDYSSSNQAGQPANTQNYPASNQHPHVPATNPPAPKYNQNQHNSQPTQYQHSNYPNQYQHNNYPNQYQHNNYPNQYQHNNYPTQYQHNNYYPNQAGSYQYPTTTLPPPQPAAHSQGGAEEYEMEDGRGGMANAGSATSYAGSATSYAGSATSYGAQLSGNPPPQYHWHYGNYGVNSHVGSHQQQAGVQSNALPLLYLALTSF